jgi:hypothetical protein
VFGLQLNYEDDVSAVLEQHGVKLINGLVDQRWARRTIAFADPARHVREIAQELRGGIDTSS